ncbi:cyclase family protein [Eubacterium callanderi]|uniref:Cyclase family protein n=1 Tax=Eubacterium callanderi TaxID=53442 RepID=A0A853JKV5_9FIRM|nr:cyclase family protein [Eubacterium callanderi]
MMQKFEKVFDMSQPVFHNCPGWPTYELTEVTYEAINPKDGFTAEVFKMNAHTATHLDAPFHFFPEGKKIDEMPIEGFQGEALIIDLRGIAPDTGITSEHLKPYADKIKEGDIVLMNTGWCKKRAMTKEYYYQWPYLTGEGAEWLHEKGVKGVGIDGLSIGGWGPDKGPQPHVVLLSKEVWLLEEIDFPDEVMAYERVYFCCFPLKLQGFGGAPARAVAMV